MSATNTPKINALNSALERSQSLKKENAGNYHNYGQRLHRFHGSD